VYFISSRQQAQLKKPDTVTIIDTFIQDIYKSAKEGNSQSGYDQSRAANPTRPMIQEQYVLLREAIKEGTGTYSFQIEYGRPNQVMIENLQRNIASFASFKCHHMAAALVDNLVGQDGSLKTYSQYRKEALQLAGQYRETWLQVEYNTTVRSSRMATLWQTIQRNKHLYPNIRYKASRAATPRGDHLALVGTILPADHSFWQKYFPPNGHGCQCGAEATDAEPTEVPPLIELPRDFSFNPGIQGRVFDLESHPYTELKSAEYQNAVKAAWSAACSAEKKTFVQAITESGMMKEKYTVPDLPQPVQLNRASIENTLSYDSHFFEKLSLLYHIEKVLESSTVIDTTPESKKQHLSKIHTLQYKAQDGKNILIRLDERKDSKCYVHSIQFPKK
jgi:hypothetical protein